MLLRSPRRYEDLPPRFLFSWFSVLLFQQENVFKHISEMCPFKAKDLLNKFSIFLSLLRIFLREKNLHFKACQKQLLLEIES
jgi:hypothetical protein